MGGLIRGLPHVASPSVSRILYLPVAGDGHPSGSPVARTLLRPTRDPTAGNRRPCLALLRVGFAEPSSSPMTLVVSYTTVSPLPVAGIHPRLRRSALCCTFRRVTPPGSYPAPCPVESGLSSTVPVHRHAATVRRARGGHCSARHNSEPLSRRARAAVLRCADDCGGDDPYDAAPRDERRARRRPASDPNTPETITAITASQITVSVGAGLPPRRAIAIITNASMRPVIIP